MRVRAKCVSKNGVEKRVMGYYGHQRIREGEMFDLVPYTGQDGKIVSAEKQFSKKWMEVVEKPSSRSIVISPEKEISEPQKQIPSEDPPAAPAQSAEPATGDADVI